MYEKDNSRRLRDYDRSLRLYMGDKNVFKESIADGEIYKDTKYNTGNPIKQAIDVDISLLLFTEDNNKDIYIEMEDEKLKDVIYNELFNNNFPVVKKTLAKDFCLLGDAFIKIYKPEGEEVKFKRIDPTYITEMQKDSRDNITYIKLEYTVKENNNNVNYTEEYSLDNFTVSKNEKTIETIQNNYGIVPFIHFKNGDSTWGESISDFLWEILKVDAELNSIAKQVTKTFVEPIYWLPVNTTQKEETKKSLKESKSDLTRGKSLKFLPEGIKIDKEEPTEIPATYLEYLAKIEKNIERLLPELSLDILLTNANASGTALSTQLSKLKQKINNLQERFISSFNLFIYYYLTILNKEGKINVNLQTLQYNCKFDSFIDSTANREKKEEEKQEIKDKIARKRLDLDKNIQYLSAGIFSEKEIKKRILKIENEIEMLEQQLEILNNIKFN